MSGESQGAIIIGATLAFAAVAWQAGIPREPPTKCEDIHVVEYLPIPVIEPLIKTPPLGWPVEERQRVIDKTPTATVAAIKEDDADERPRRHHHRRHWRRR